MQSNKTGLEVITFSFAQAVIEALNQLLGYFHGCSLRYYIQLYCVILRSVSSTLSDGTINYFNKTEHYNNH